MMLTEAPAMRMCARCILSAAARLDDPAAIDRPGSRRA
jgi:hypothetical protein